MRLRPLQTNPISIAILAPLDTATTNKRQLETKGCKKEEENSHETLLILLYLQSGIYTQKRNEPRKREIDLVQFQIDLDSFRFLNEKGQRDKKKSV